MPGRGAPTEEDGGGQDFDEDRRIGGPSTPNAGTAPANAGGAGRAADGAAGGTNGTAGKDDTDLQAQVHAAALAIRDAADEAAVDAIDAVEDAAQLEEAISQEDKQTGGMLALCGCAALTSKTTPKRSSLTGSSVDAAEEIGPQEKVRYWELTMTARSMELVADDQCDAFFAVSVRAENPRIHKNHVKLLNEYTPAYLLVKGERKTLDVPLVLYDKRMFRLSYKEMKKHIFKIDMWKVSHCSFNRYYGKGIKNLWDVATHDANISIRIKKKFTLKEEEDMKKKKRQPPDQAQFECTINLEEMFDFQLMCENWSLELAKKSGKQFLAEYHKRMKEQKTLTFIMPKHAKANPSYNRACTSIRGEWQECAPGQSLWVWNRLGQPATFRGTRTGLSNKFFIVSVHSGNPMSKSLPPMGGGIGKALMGLTSVLDISVFKGNVKALDMREERFYVGTVTGSVRCTPFARGETKVEDVPGGRPSQGKATLSVMHLDPAEKHLVIFVRKCEGLAVAIADKGNSDPCLRVVWDNMVQKSLVLKSTVRPVFNQLFYFPVRLFNPHCLDRRYQDNALVYEYMSKGDIQIQVWDDDETSSESLGNIILPLQSLLASKTFEKRTMRGPPPKASTEEVNELAKPSKKQWYDEEREVRVYDGSGMELMGAPPSTTTPIITFEAYFYPDYPKDLHLKSSTKTDDTGWREKEKEWNRRQTEFAKNYAQPFPESIGAKRHVDNSFQRTDNLRRFTAIVAHPQTRTQLPLPALLVRIITPKEYSAPSVLLHWINSVTFFSSPRQTRTGQIPPDGWKDPQYLLFRRMGPAQDHAILLCSVLLGCGKDAWVCKGTVWVHDDEHGHGGPSAFASQDGVKKKKPPRLVEHAWVMTREAGGFVTFWEPCTREMYHLPHRYTESKKKKKSAGEKGNGSGAGGAGDGEFGAEEEEEALAIAQPQEVWNDEVPDVAIQPEEFESLPTIGRMPRPKQKADKSNKGKAARDKLQEQLAKQRENLLVAPNKAMIRDGYEGSETATLVDWLPYDSIDVVFNMDNLFANHQNHHPACITYDMDDEKRWAPLLSKEERKSKAFNWMPVCGDVLIDPQLKPEQVSRLEQEMEIEMQENMKLYRNKRGYDTFFDMRKVLKQDLDSFLDIQESLRRMDVDLCPIWEKQDTAWTEAERYVIEQLKFGKCKRPYNRYGTPFSSTVSPEMANYHQSQLKEWEVLLKKVAAFIKRQPLFPVRKGKSFKGLPVHFSTADKEQIRGYLMASPRYCELMDRDTEGQMFYTVHCKIYALLGGIQSTWLYFGVQIPQEEFKKDG